MTRIWRGYGLSITLAVLFLVSWALQTWTGWTEFVAGRGSAWPAGRAVRPGRLHLVLGPGHIRELAVRVPAGLRVHRADHVPRAPQEPRVTRHGLRHGSGPPPDRGQDRSARAGARVPMSARKDETQLTEEDIYEEHQRTVKPTAHWALSLRRPRRRAPVHGRPDRPPRWVGLRTARVSGSTCGSGGLPAARRSR